MKTVLSSLIFLVASSAFAGVPASQDPVDYGTSVGALNSKVFRVKAGKFNHAVIAANFAEPACNPVRILVTVTDDAIEGEDPTITYNLGAQVSSIVSVRAEGNRVLITARVSTPEDCSKKLIRTYQVQYKDQNSDLIFSAK